MIPINPNLIFLSSFQTVNLNVFALDDKKTFPLLRCLNTLFKCVDDNSRRSSLMVLCTIYCFWLYMAAVLCVKYCHFFLQKDFSFLRCCFLFFPFFFSPFFGVKLFRSKVFFFLNFLFSMSSTILFMESSYPKKRHQPKRKPPRLINNKQSFHDNQNSLKIPFPFWTLLWRKSNSESA